MKTSGQVIVPGSSLSCGGGGGGGGPGVIGVRPALGKTAAREAAKRRLAEEAQAKGQQDRWAALIGREGNPFKKIHVVVSPWEPAKAQVPGFLEIRERDGVLLGWHLRLEKTGDESRDRIPPVRFGSRPSASN